MKVKSFIHKVISTCVIKGIIKLIIQNLEGSSGILTIIAAISTHLPINGSNGLSFNVYL